MKVAVSVPDAVFEAVERLAERRGCSRSSLYRQALELLLAGADRENVTARLDEVYADQTSGVAPDIRAAQHRALTDGW